MRAEIDLSAWSLRVADLIGTIDDAERLPGRMIDVLRAVAPAEIGYVTLNRAEHLPREISLYPKGYRHPHAWAEGLYVLDPLYQAYEAGLRGVCSLRQVMPTGFETTAYFQRFYGRYGVVDEMLHAIDLPVGGSVFLGVVRGEEQGIFSRDDRARHEALHPVMVACAHRLAELVADREDPADRLKTLEVECALERFGAGELTPRELDVIHLVLRGHNTESVATQLAIAADTVKLHRKHAYAKLRVNSQGELFFKFLESLGLDEQPGS